ncbi:hypothetical protein HPB47_004916, partial [Ixodes persulcatus]
MTGAVRYACGRYDVSLVSRIMEYNPEIQVAFPAIFPKQVSLQKNGRWSVSAEVLHQHNGEAKEMTFILQELCRKGGYGFINGGQHYTNVTLIAPCGLWPGGHQEMATAVRCKP